MSQNSDHLFKVPKIIDSPNIVLKKLVLKDANDFFREINKINVLKYLHITKPEVLSDVKDLIRYFRKNWRKNQAYTFSIFNKNTDHQKINSKVKHGYNKQIFCGSINISNIDYYEKTGEIGIWLGEKYWNTGINYEAIKMILQCGFDALLLNKIQALILPDNIRSIKTFENLNFKFEGKKKSNPFKNQTQNGIYIYSILKKEFEEYFGKKKHEISHEKK